MNEGGERPEDEGGKDIPEVEAELVEETAPAAAAFEDAAPAGPPPPDTEPDAAAPRRKTLTPGVVLFILFSVAALGVFGYWRFQDRPARTPERPAAETAAMESAPALAGEKAASAAGAETASEQEATPSAVPLPAQDKIANAAPDGVKAPEATHAGATNAGATDVAPSGGFLPPVGAAAAAKLSNTVEDGAKEALQKHQEEADAAEKTAPAQEPAAPLPDVPPADGISGFDIERSTPAAADAVSDGAMGPEEDDTLSPSGEAAEMEPAKVDNDLAALKQEFAAEAQRLEAALAEERRRSADQAAEITALREELAAALSAKDQAANEEVTALRAQLEKIRNEDVKISTQHMKASFALTALTRAVDQGDPYVEELAAISQFEPAAGASLAAHAETGVATEAALRERFGAAARAALAAAEQERAGGGVAGLMARAKSVISVRPATPQAGDAPGAVISRAENALSEGETAFALLQLEDLPLVAQSAMADWIADARARAEAEAALAMLQSRLAGEAE